MSEKINSYKVVNYRYGLPVGTIVAKDKVDEDRLRFLVPIEDKKTIKKEDKK